MSVNPVICIQIQAINIPVTRSIADRGYWDSDFVSLMRGIGKDNKKTRNDKANSMMLSALVVVVMQKKISVVRENRR